MPEAQPSSKKCSARCHVHDEYTWIPIPFLLSSPAEPKEQGWRTQDQATGSPYGIFGQSTLEI